jgi:hypothetical protein
MRSGKIHYAGVIGAVAGVLSVLGVYSIWWQTEGPDFRGTAHVTGDLALWASIAMFVFAGASILFSDPGIRRAMGALMTISAVVLTAAAVVGAYSGDEVASGATIGGGLWASGLAGLLGICAGLLALQGSIKADEDAAAMSHDAPVTP